uniref:Uncharacterized protein n=1 Tax=Ascaris lumbricoides TaxID=6252 RepID=A0A0M3IA85_ASCLU
MRSLCLSDKETKMAQEPYTAMKVEQLRIDVLIRESRLDTPPQEPYMAMKVEQLRIDVLIRESRLDTPPQVCYEVNGILIAKNFQC